MFGEAGGLVGFAPGWVMRSVTTSAASCAPSGWALFAQDKYAGAVPLAQGSEPPRHVMSVLGEQWRGLSDNEKNEWKKKAKQVRCFASTACTTLGLAGPFVCHALLTPPSLSTAGGATALILAF